ncbi:hypothetical protein LCGC14_2512870 [marine sediment metagenome]|uniref:Uncharacterized protein n=1 Tax=marine sediment metagenome TaxID=412755 RepID=A0A0F9AZB5_9ZZZZ
MSASPPINPADNTAFGKGHCSRQAARKVRAIEVSEWGKPGKPLILYAYPLTINDVIELEGKYRTQTEQNVMQLIRQCMDSKGDPFFTLLDKAALQNEPADIIGRVLTKLNGESSSFTEELKKNKE